MRIKQVKVGKEFKIGLPNYSNITIQCKIVFELAKEEKLDWGKVWDEVNQQLSIQSDGIDPSWITTREYKNFFKTTIKTPK